MNAKLPVCGLLFAALASQLAAQIPDGLPSERGIYYRADSGWVALPATLLQPLLSGGVARQLLGFGHRSAGSELPGPHSLFRTANAKPTFYVRGYSPLSGMYLVRANVGQDYRELPTRVNRHFPEGPVLHKENVYGFDAASVGPGVITLTPHMTLPAGEYAILAPPEPGYTWVKFGFGFGVPPSTGGQ